MYNTKRNDCCSTVLYGQYTDRMPFIGQSLSPHRCNVLRIRRNVKVRVIERHNRGVVGDWRTRSSGRLCAARQFPFTREVTAKPFENMGRRDDLLLGFAAGVALVASLAALQRFLLLQQGDEGGAPPVVQHEHVDDAKSDDASSDDDAAAAADSPATPPAAAPPPSLLQMQTSSRQAVHKLQRVTTASKVVADISSMIHVDRRYLTPPRETLELCQSTLAVNSSRPWEASRQTWFISACSPATPLPRVHNRLWVTYRMWVDEHVAGREGRPDIFHNFIVSRALGIPQSGRFSWTGTEAGDLLTCLAAAGVLVRGCQGGKAALEQFLADSLQAYNNRFRLARNRTVEGLTRDEQCEWDGPYDFVQLAGTRSGRRGLRPGERSFGRVARIRGLLGDATSGLFLTSHLTSPLDPTSPITSPHLTPPVTSRASSRFHVADPQIGMFKMDSDWAEELTMLRMAVQHVNRLKPRFLLVSGDLTNAWPSEKTRDVVASQVSAFKEALRGAWGGRRIWWLSLARSGSHRLAPARTGSHRLSLSLSLSHSLSLSLSL